MLSIQKMDTIRSTITSLDSSINKSAGDFNSLDCISNDNLQEIIENDDIMQIFTKWIISGGNTLNAITPFLIKWIWYRESNSGLPIFGYRLSNDISLINVLFQKLISEDNKNDQLCSAKIFDALANMNIPHEKSCLAFYFLKNISFSDFIEFLSKVIFKPQGDLSVFIGGILHGFAKYMRISFIQSFPNFVDEVLFPTMKSIINSTDLNILGLQVQIILTISHLVGNEEDSVLTKFPQALKNIVTVLEKSVNNENYGVLCFGVSGLLDGIYRTIISDSNKSIYLQTPLIDLLCYILCIQMRSKCDVTSILKLFKSGNYSVETFIKCFNVDNINFPYWSISESISVKVLSCLEHLCFSPQVVSLLKDINILSILLLYSESSNEKIRNVVHCIKWKITAESNTIILNNKNENIQSHVMISYAWANQDTVKQISHYLQEHGVKVWLDIESMHGSIVDAMAEAVEGAHLVLVCMSQAYKESVNCRLEAEYAMQQRKPFIPIMMEQGFKPNGWLGLMLGQKLYFNAFGSSLLDEEGLAKILNEVRNNSVKQTTSIVESKQIITNTNKVMLKPISNYTENENFSKVSLWTVEDVANWLKSSELNDYVETFKSVEMDGLSMIELNELLTTDATVSYGYLVIETKLNIKKVGHILKFAHKLKSIFRK